MKRLTYLLLCLLMPAMAAAENAPVKYTDAASLTIVNKAQPGGPAFQRIDVARYPELTPTVTRYYRYSTGLAVVFRTDSRNIRARWTTVNQLPGANSTLIAQRGLDLYIRRDGKWVFAGVGVPSKSGTQHEAPVVEHMDTTMKECLLYLPLHDEIAALEIGTDEGALLEAAPDPFRHRIVVIGSSITHGTSASRPGMAYAARLDSGSSTSGPAGNASSIHSSRASPRRPGPTPFCSTPFRTRRPNRSTSGWKGSSGASAKAIPRRR